MAPRKLQMFCKEDRLDREVSWAGFGFQVWLQFLTHLVAAPDEATLIVDEADIDLHPIFKGNYIT